MRTLRRSRKKQETKKNLFRVIQAELLDSEEDGEPTKIVWCTGKDQAEQDGKEPWR